MLVNPDPKLATHQTGRTQLRSGDAQDTQRRSMSYATTSVQNTAGTIPMLTFCPVFAARSSSLRPSWSAIRLALLVAGAILLPLWLDPNLEPSDGTALLALNALPLVIMAGLCLGLTRRPGLSLLMLTGFIVWIFFVNAKKLEALLQPAVFSDFLLIWQTIRGFGLLGNYGNALPLLLLLVSFAAAIVFLLTKEPPVLRRPAGLALAGTCSLLLLSLGQEWLPPGKWYHQAPITPQEWNPIESVRLNGLVASITRASSRARFQLPDTQTPEPVRPASLAGLQTAPLRQPPRSPDVIVMLAESFFDPSILAQVGECELLPAWCALKAQGVSGTLEVPTYAGNTTRSEFELLTAVPFSIFEGVDYVYLSVVTRPVHSLPWMLRGQGYETVAIHNHMGYFWNRNRALPLLGFHRFVAMEKMEGIEELGFYASDDVLTPELYKALESAPSSRPIFTFLISMENHGPWDVNRRDRLPESVSDIEVPEVVSDIEGEPLQQYLFHAERFVHQLTAIWNQLKARDRDTLLIVFGDHLPGLNQVFQVLGFDNGLEPPQQFTPFLVLANFDLEANPPAHLPIHQLLPQVFHAGGMLLDPVYAELRAAFSVPAPAGPAPGEARHDYLEDLSWRLLKDPQSSEFDGGGRK